MSEATRGDGGTTAAPPGRTGRGQQVAPWRALLTGTLLVLLVLGTVSAGYLGYRTLRPTDEPFNPTAGNVLPSDQERARAVATAEQFTLRMDNVDGARFEAYVEGVNELLTEKARAENQESLEVLQQTYEAAEVEGTGEILLSGVANLSETSATVLVAHDAEVTTNQGDVEHFYRWTVDLVMVGDEWRVDGFTPVS